MRHKPEAIGISLDRGGWVSIEALLKGCIQSGYELSRSTLIEVVEQNDKSRFVIRDGLIRASQGHSIDVDLGLVPMKPPTRLFHGTATRFLPAIRRQGLRRQSRNFVHLSPDEGTATKVGERHGRPVVLRIQSEGMWQAGWTFYLSENGVWLVHDVPVAFIEIPTID